MQKKKKKKKKKEKRKKKKSQMLPPSTVKMAKGFYVPHQIRRFMPGRADSVSELISFSFNPDVNMYEQLSPLPLLMVTLFVGSCHTPQENIVCIHNQESLCCHHFSNTWNI
jgi:hypothetical protein